MTIRFDRLRTLHAFMAALPENQINMNCIVRTGSADMKKVKAGFPDECGAVACAMGWAGLMPEFRAEGLKWHPKRGTHTVGGTAMSWDTAAKTFFGMPEAAVIPLFGVVRGTEQPHFATFTYRLKTLFEAYGQTL